MEQFCESEREVAEYETVFTGSDEETGPGTRQRRRRQQSVPEMMRARQQKEPRAAKRQRQASGKPGGGSEITLEAIEALIDAGNSRIIQTIEAKFSSLERRLEIMEGELFEKSSKIECLEREMHELQQENVRLAEQVEGIDTNRRMNSLIFFCKDFGEPRRGENIEDKLVDVLNRHIPEVEIRKDDFQTVHRLYGSDKVIAKFIKTDKRNEVYEQRFVMAKRSGEQRQRNSLFISESLSQGRREIFNIMLEAKRCQVVHAVFTKRGIVHIKRHKEAVPQEVDDVQKAREILRNGPRQAAGQRSEARGRDDRRPLPAPTAAERGRGRSTRGGARGGSRGRGDGRPYERAPAQSGERGAEGAEAPEPDSRVGGGGARGSSRDGSRVRGDERRTNTVTAPIEEAGADPAERQANRENRGGQSPARGNGDSRSGPENDVSDNRGSASNVAGDDQRGDSRAETTSVGAE